MIAPWPDHEVDELKARWANHEPFSDIARALHKTRNAVIGKAHRLKLFRPNELIRITQAHKPKPRRFKPNGHKMTGELMIEDEPPQLFAAGKRFIELEAGDCHWPGPDRPGPNMLCCAAPVVAGMPYCAEHCRMAKGAAPRSKP